MSIRRAPCVSALVLSVVWSVSASAQTVDPPPLREQILDLTGILAAEPAGVAIGLATALEVANAPFGSSAGGFVFKLDPATGLKVRSAPTFGPSFAERALTAGEGKVSFGINLTVATYDKLNNFSLKRMRLAQTSGPVAAIQNSGIASLVLSSETMVVSAAIGATDKLDISVAVPFVKVTLNGISWVEDAKNPPQVFEFLAREGNSSGRGDLAVSAKYRLAQFGAGPPDPGGVAFLLTTRLPTGNRENFRGLGINRVLGSLVVSAGKGKLRPHGNVGFEWWEKGLVVATDVIGADTVEARHQMQAAVGLEIDAGPKMTLLLDVLGRQVLGGGVVGLKTFPLPSPDVTSIELAVATGRPIRKLVLAPGLKWNLKGTFVLTGNALISLRDNGLHDYFTPVVGLDWTF
jgi:hypothetical protein